MISETIVFVGDICLAGKPAETIKTGGIAAELRSIFGDTAYIIGTIECAISDRGQPKPFKACLRSPFNSRRILEGITVGLLGNNHVCDFGDDAAQDTIRALSYSGCLHSGYGRSYSEATLPAVIEVAGAKVAMLSVCCPTTRPDGLASSQTAGVAPISADGIKSMIAQAKAIADLVVLCPHWGVQGERHPCALDVRLARYAIQCGADAVIGTHAHVIQSSEEFAGAPIFYGLGNYTFDDVSAEYFTHEGKSAGRGYLVRQNPTSLTSLVVELRPHYDGGKWKLIVQSRRIAKMKPDYSHEFELVSKKLSVDIELCKLIQTCPESLSVSGEYVYRAHIKNGIVMYNHPEPPLGKYTFARRIFHRLVRLGRKTRGMIQ